jgi:hypothetical protein
MRRTMYREGQSNYKYTTTRGTKQNRQARLIYGWPDETNRNTPAEQKARQIDGQRCTAKDIRTTRKPGETRNDEARRSKINIRQDK